MTTTPPARWIPVTYTDADPPGRPPPPRAAQLSLIAAGAVALALAAWLAVVVFARVTGAVTIGAVSVDAATDPLLYTAAEVRATVEAAVVLNAGYAVFPTDVMPVPPAEPGGAVLPTTGGMFGPLDSGAPPGWLSRELTPYWGSIAAAAHEVGIDSHWLGIVAMVENPQAITAIVTFDGGHGLAQIQRETAALIQSQSGLPCVNGWADPVTSYRCGAWYFRGAVRDGAGLARPGDAEPALLMGVAGYNSGHGSAIVGTLRRALAGGAGDPCAAIGNQYTRRYCYAARDMWAGSLAERDAGPDAGHLEATNR